MAKNRSYKTNKIQTHPEGATLATGRSAGGVAGGLVFKLRHRGVLPGAGAMQAMPGTGKEKL